MSAAIEGLARDAEVVLCRHGAFDRVADGDGRIAEHVAADDLARFERLAAALGAAGRTLILASAARERTLRCARVLSDALELPVYVDPDLDEVRLEKPPGLDDASTRELWSAVRARPDRPPRPGAESQRAVGERARATLRGLVRSSESALVVAITHGGLIEALVGALDAPRRGEAQALPAASITAVDVTAPRIHAVGLTPG